ncbi:hypothetical protein LIER_34538 [Lithospermum erythrorhizon]|uniref:Uncharacterized protein n=1 Tax=Lithospermum erythrorhizon TaxID=34254 RepID=A0AAV3S2T0_LITER
MLRRERRRLRWRGLRVGEGDMVASMEGGNTSVQGGRRLNMRNRVFKRRHYGGGETRRHFVVSSVGNSTPLQGIGRSSGDKRVMNMEVRRRRMG